MGVQGNECAGHCAQDTAHGIDVTDTAGYTKAGAAHKWILLTQKCPLAP